MFIDIREDGREKNWCEKHQLVASTRNQTHNLAMCPDQELNPQCFGVWDNVPTNRATLLEPLSFFWGRTQVQESWTELFKVISLGKGRGNTWTRSSVSQHSALFFHLLSLLYVLLLHTVLHVLTTQSTLPSCWFFRKLYLTCLIIFSSHSKKRIQQYCLYACQFVYLSVFSSFIDI